MNILFVTIVDPYSGKPAGGAETSIRLMAHKLAERGHDVTYLAQSGSVTSRRSAREEGVRFVTWIRRSRRVQWAGRIGNWLRIQQTRWLFRSRRIGVVYCFYETGVLSTLLAARQGNTPKIVMRMAGFAWVNAVTKAPETRDLYVRLFSAVDAVNYLDSSMAQAVEARLNEHCLPVTFRHSFNGDIGSSASVGRSDAYADLPEAPFDLLMPARFSGSPKRQDLLVRAMALLPRNLPVQLTLIGSGRQYQAIADLVLELGLEDRIRMMQFVSQQELWDRMSRSHLLCLATDHEGVGKVVLEAMSVGLPVLGSDVDILKYYVDEGRTGFLCQNTPEAWAGRIKALMTDAAARQRVSKIGMDYVRERQDPDRNIRHLERQFADIAGR